MLHLSAFADEISPHLDEQIEVCRENGVTHFELRSVEKVNVLDLSDDTLKEIKTKLRDNGMGVISIGSPIGKVAIDLPWQDHFARFKKAVDIAGVLGAPLIRVFSYYPAGGEGKGPIEPHRSEVMDRFREKVAYLEEHPVAMVHENERGIYGDTGQRCLDLMQAINSPKLRSAFDFANFVIGGERPAENWLLLKPFTAHIHVKDAVLATGQVVPAGQGDGDIGSILADAHRSGYRGFVSMEPHLKVAGHSHGETGPELFKVAVDALKEVSRRNGVPLAGESAV